MCREWRAPCILNLDIKGEMSAINMYARNSYDFEMHLGHVKTGMNGTIYGWPIGHLMKAIQQ